MLRIIIVLSVLGAFEHQTCLGETQTDDWRSQGFYRPRRNYPSQSQNDNTYQANRGQNYQSQNAFRSEISQSSIGTTNGQNERKPFGVNYQNTQKQSSFSSNYSQPQYSFGSGRQYSQASDTIRKNFGQNYNQSVFGTSNQNTQRPNTFGFNSQNSFNNQKNKTQNALGSASQNYFAASFSQNSQGANNGQNSFGSSFSHPSLKPAVKTSSQPYGSLSQNTQTQNYFERNFNNRSQNYFGNIGQNIQPQNSFESFQIQNAFSTFGSNSAFTKGHHYQAPDYLPPKRFMAPEYLPPKEPSTTTTRRPFYTTTTTKRRFYTTTTTNRPFYSTTTTNRPIFTTNTTKRPIFTTTTFRTTERVRPLPAMASQVPPEPTTTRRPIVAPAMAMFVPPEEDDPTTTPSTTTSTTPPTTTSTTTTTTPSTPTSTSPSTTTTTTPSITTSTTTTTTPSTTTSTTPSTTTSTTPSTTTPDPNRNLIEDESSPTPPPPEITTLSTTTFKAPEYLPPDSTTPKQLLPPPPAPAMADLVPPEPKCDPLDPSTYPSEEDQRYFGDSPCSPTTTTTVKTPYKGPLYLPPPPEELCVPKTRVRRSSEDTLRLADLAGKPRPVWYAGIYKKVTDPYYPICGGSIVREDIVISAAHCFWDDVGGKQPAELFAVATRKIYKPWKDPMDKMAQKSDVLDITIPPRYLGVKASFQEDIAILKLATPFKFTPVGVRPICVDFDVGFDRQQLRTGHYGTFAGWGFTDSVGTPTQRLLWLELPYIEIGKCIQDSEESFLKYITSDKVCAGENNTGKALCRGDSGGGLAFWQGPASHATPYLRGVASAAPADKNAACNVFAYGSFTWLYAHRTFLRDHLPDIEKCRFWE